ncbi:MAG: DUF6541 family protein [Chloroflexota bacterium]
MAWLPWRNLLIALFLCAVPVLVGCGPLADPQAQQWRATHPAEFLSAGQSLSQTFVASRDHLTSLDVLFAVRPEGGGQDGELWLTVREADTGRELVAARAPLSSWRHNERYRLAFPPQPDSAGREYELTLRSTSLLPSPATLWLASDDAYPWGDRAVDGRPAVGDLVFRAFYDYQWTALLADLATEAGRRGGAWALVLALLFLPGLALRSLLIPNLELDAAEAAGLALGISLALAPLLLYVSTLVGARLNAATIWAVLAGATGILVWRFAARGGLARRPRWGWPSPAGAAYLATGAALVLRFVHARDLALPMWVDSVHHTLISRLIVQSGTLPADYGSLIPAQPFNYHFGFHTVVAITCWLGGLEVDEAVLFVGQLLNGLVVLPTYLLASRLCGDRRAGLVAGMIAGLVTTMPAYYVSWGRYPQLAGLLLLPAAIVVWRLCWQGLEERPRASFSPAPVLLAALLAAGLVLVHPRVALLFASWVLAEAAVLVVAGRRQPATIWRLALVSLGVAALSVVVLWPWLFRLALSSPGALLLLPEESPAAFPFALLTSGADGLVLAAALGGAVLGLARRRRVAILLIAWLGLSLLVANPHWLRLPLNPLLGNGALAIALFLPLATLSGLLSREILLLLRFGDWRPAARAALGVALLGGGGLSAVGLADLVNPDCVLATQADVAALRWVDAATPPQAAFLVNARYWQHGAYVGTDGGYWISPLAGRRTSTPPVLYNQAQAPTVARINDLAAQVAEPNLTAGAIAQLMRAEGLTHVFIGSWAGPLTADLLVGAREFAPVYAAEGVWVFVLLD